MAIIYTYPQINSSSDLAASDLMIISDMSANGRPTKSLKLSDLATFITNTGTGSGTTNKITKWTDGASGLLGDSSITDVGNQVSMSTDFIINFAHPFQTREDLLPRQQIDLLLRFFQKNLNTNHNIRLIHMSSMSVYEPFGNGVYFSESKRSRPSNSDEYAFNKYSFEKSLLNLQGIRDRIMIIRPTVVYGPFCRPWTDNIMKTLFSGNLFFTNLSGRIQPIFVRDISQFLLECATDFIPGIFNIAGPEVITWNDFFQFFKAVVDNGDLVAVEHNAVDKTDQAIKGDFKNLLKQLNQDTFIAHLFKTILIISIAKSKSSIIILTFRI